MYFALVKISYQMHSLTLTIRIEQIGIELFVGFIKEVPSIAQIKGNTLIEVYDQVCSQLVAILKQKDNLKNVQIHKEFRLAVPINFPAVPVVDN